MSGEIQIQRYFAVNLLLAAGVLVVDSIALLLVGEASHDSAQSIGTSAKCRLRRMGRSNSHLSTMPILNEVVDFLVGCRVVLVVI